MAKIAKNFTHKPRVTLKNLNRFTNVQKKCAHHAKTNVYLFIMKCTEKLIVKDDY